MLADGVHGNSRTREVIAFLSTIFVIAIWGETFVSSKVLLGHGMVPAESMTRHPFYRKLFEYVEGKMQQ